MALDKTTTTTPKPVMPAIATLERLRDDDSDTVAEVDVAGVGADSVVEWVAPVGSRSL